MTTEISGGEALRRQAATFPIVLVTVIGQAVGIWATPETAGRCEGLAASLKPTITVPQHTRSQFFRVTPLVVVI
ncbi:hypothetical protein ACJ7V3_16915 [Halomonas elongata]|uniref:hypothetical protein n=1 Tax=Halomonas elongata TaxID=2746 RepID=UPI0038D49F96